jgi:hypothetical protein
MAGSLKRHPLNIGICFALWLMRGADKAPPPGLGWSGLPIRWGRVAMKQGLATGASRR